MFVLIEWPLSGLNTEINVKLLLLTIFGDYFWSKNWLALDVEWRFFQFSILSVVKTNHILYVCALFLYPILLCELFAYFWIISTPRIPYTRTPGVESAYTKQHHQAFHHQRERAKKPQRMVLEFQTVRFIKFMNLICKVYLYAIFCK